MRDFKNLLSLGPEWIDQVQNIMQTQSIMTTVCDRFDRELSTSVPGSSPTEHHSSVRKLFTTC